MLFLPSKTSDFEYYFFLFSKIEISDSHDNAHTALEKANIIPGTYGHGFAKRLISPIFTFTYDLKKDYQMFYSEYDSFESYLYNKYLLDESTIKDLFSKSETYGTIYYGELGRGMSYSMCEQIFQNEKYIDMINKLIGDLDDEN